MQIPHEEAKAEAGWTPTPSPQPVQEEVTKGGSGELTQQGSSAASLYKSRVSGHLSSSPLRHLSVFWIKAVYIASIVMSAVVGLPLLRMAFSGEGTSYLAVVFFIQGWALTGMVMYPWIHTFYGEKGVLHLTIVYVVLGGATAVSNAFTALTTFKDPLAGQPKTLAYQLSNAVYYELYLITVLYMAWIYRKQATVKGWGMYTATIPFYLYCLGAVQLLRFSNGRIDIWQYTFLIPFFLVATYWIDRSKARAGLITFDRGYLMLVILFSNGATVSIGGFMLTWLLKVEKGPDFFAIILQIAWSLTGLVFWLMWRQSAIAASDKVLFTPLMFALQLTITLYSELIFLSISLRSPFWWLLVLYDMCIVVFKESGYAMHVVRKLRVKYAIWRAQRQGVQLEPVATIDDRVVPPGMSYTTCIDQEDGQEPDVERVPSQPVLGGDGAYSATSMQANRELAAAADPPIDAVQTWRLSPSIDEQVQAPPAAVSSQAAEPTPSAESRARSGWWAARSSGGYRSSGSQEGSIGAKKRNSLTMSMELPRFDSTLKMNAGTAVLSVALGKNQGLIAIVEGQEEDEEVSHVVESQAEVSDLGTTICVLILFPLELLMRKTGHGKDALTLGYTWQQQLDIIFGYVIIFCLFFVSRWISHRVASHLARQNKTPEELEEERKTKERVEKEHWVSHMPYFVALTVFIIMDAIFRLIQLRFSALTEKPVHAF